jgi:hypothetical protein
MKYAPHRYFDVANLNAIYDNDWAPPGYPNPPLRGLGAGVLAGGSALGIPPRVEAYRSGSLGAEDPAYPWKVKSGSTQRLQGDLNEHLARKKMNILVTDGILAGRTCGAIKWALDQGEELWANPSTCADHVSEWIAPTKAGSGAPYVPPTVKCPEGQVADASGKCAPIFVPADVSGNKWLWIGGAVAAMAIGGALFMKSKKKRHAHAA